MVYQVNCLYNFIHSIWIYITQTINKWIKKLYPHPYGPWHEKSERVACTYWTMKEWGHNHDVSKIIAIMVKNEINVTWQNVRKYIEYMERFTDLTRPRTRLTYEHSHKSVTLVWHWTPDIRGATPRLRKPFITICKICAGICAQNGVFTDDLPKCICKK